MQSSQLLPTLRVDSMRRVAFKPCGARGAAPTVNQPGFIAELEGRSYDLISDVPEQGTSLLAGAPFCLHHSAVLAGLREQGAPTKENCGACARARQSWSLRGRVRDTTGG